MTSSVTTGARLTTMTEDVCSASPLGTGGHFSVACAPAMRTVFGNHLTSIQRIVQGVVDEPGSAFPEAAVRAYGQLGAIEGIGSGIATRLLALARPDRFVSLNGASKEGLARSFGVAPGTLSEPRSYGRLLNRLYSEAWYRDARPIDAREESIRWMCAALLDCFVYEQP